MESLEHDMLLNIEQLMEYLPWKPAKPTIYLATCKGRIPGSFRKGRRLFFMKSSIDNYIAERACKQLRKKQDG